MRQQRIDTVLGQLAVCEIGDGPVAFLWPSLYADHRSLVPLATELAGLRRCVLIDGPGHGRSSVPPRRYTMRDCARAAIQVLDALGVDRIDWIGNAWGGHVGVAAALTSPERLRSLTVIGAPLEPLSPSLRRKTQLVLGLLALGARSLVGALVGRAMIAPGSPKAHRRDCRLAVRDGRGRRTPRSAGASGRDARRDRALLGGTWRAARDGLIDRVAPSGRRMRTRSARLGLTPRSHSVARARNGT